MTSHGVAKNTQALGIHWKIGICELGKLFCFLRIHPVVGIPETLKGTRIKSGIRAKVPAVMCNIAATVPGIWSNDNKAMFRGSLLKTGFCYEILLCAS